MDFRDFPKFWWLHQALALHLFGVRSQPRYLRSSTPRAWTIALVESRVARFFICWSTSNCRFLMSILSEKPLRLVVPRPLKCLDGPTWLLSETLNIIYESGTNFLLPTFIARGGGGEGGIWPTPLFCPILRFFGVWSILMAKSGGRSRGRGLPFFCSKWGYFCKVLGW